MSDHTTSHAQPEPFVTEMLNRFERLARSLSEWVQSEPHSLADLEHQVVHSLKELGTALLAGLCQLAVPTYPASSLPCPCGATAPFQRRRTATVKTVLDTIRLSRPYYLCATCQHGFAPLDQQLEFCAGARSSGLDELLALLGATQHSFAAAATVLEKLTLVTVCANSVREATETLGQALFERDTDTPPCSSQAACNPPVLAPIPKRVYISMDGVLVHIRDTGWKEVKLGSIYTTSTHRSAQQCRQLELRAEQQSFVAALSDAAGFGERLWAEAVRRQVAQAEEVVVIGEGAHWIWNLAEAYFPQAVQIVDWYHASAYVWRAATACYGEGSERAKSWASEQLDQLWNGNVAAVLSALRAMTNTGSVVTETLTYFGNHQARMQYDVYRASGMQIGSGTMESGCKQVIAARLKQAGMIWKVEGAVAVATVRTWLKSGRWNEAMQVRKKRRRRYQRERQCATRQQLEQTAATVLEGERRAEMVSTQMHPERKAEQQAIQGSVQEQHLSAADMSVADEQHPQVEPQKARVSHPWRKAWSIRRQEQQLAEQAPPARLLSA